MAKKGYKLYKYSITAKTDKGYYVVQSLFHTLKEAQKEKQKLLGEQTNYGKISKVIIKRMKRKVYGV